MQVLITSRHGVVQPSVQDYIRQKAEKLLTYFDRVTAISVTVDFENSHSTVEILVDAEHKHNFVAAESGDGVQGVFDTALHKMEQQIRKYKEQIQDHRRTPAISELTEEVAKRAAQKDAAGDK